LFALTSTSIDFASLLGKIMAFSDIASDTGGTTPKERVSFASHAIYIEIVDGSLHHDLVRAHLRRKLARARVAYQPADQLLIIDGVEIRPDWASAAKRAEKTGCDSGNLHVRLFVSGLL